MGKEHTSNPSQGNRLKLAKVTPRAMRVISKYAKEEDGKITLSLKDLTEAATVEEIARAIFDEKFENTDFDEFDLNVLMRGFSDFLSGGPRD